MRKYKYYVLTVLLMALFAMSSATAQIAEQKLSRTLSYDPHPSTAHFSDPAPVNNELLPHEVVFHEVWKSDREPAALGQIHFSLRAVKGNTVVASASTAPFVIRKITRGQQIGVTSLGNTSFTATVDDFETKNGNYTDLTVSLKISYPEARVEMAIETLANQRTSNSLDFCQKLAARADSLPVEQKKARLSIYKKVLLVAPSPESSPEAELFYNRISGLVAELESGNKPVEPAEIIPVAPAPMDETASSSVDEEPVSLPEPVPAVENQVKPESRELLRQAETLFAQDKGQEGREALRRALEISPDFREALILLGTNAYENRKYARAKEAFGKVLDLDSHDADSLLHYFKACYYLGEGSEAILRLAAEKERFPTDNRIKLATAEAYFQLGDLIAARDVCNEILAAEPASSEGRNLLARINKLLK